MATSEKQYLFDRGLDRVNEFLDLNKIPRCKVVVVPKTNFGVCAYYRSSKITISIDQCAYKAGANKGRNWNWPGSTTDRTPYGVLAHEVGHHVDLFSGSKKGAYWSDYGENLYKRSKEKAITSYAPDPSEWFAEMFRLFITNPNLLSELRPVTYGLLTERFVPLEPQKRWEEVLEQFYTSPLYIEANLRKKVSECIAKSAKGRRESGIKR